MDEPIDPRLAEYLRTHCGPHCYGEQDENGVDLSLIRSNLKLSPEERLIQGDDARRSAIELREYGRIYWQERRSQVR